MGHCLTVCRRHYETAVGGLKEVKTDAKFVLLVSRRLFTCHANRRHPQLQQRSSNPLTLLPPPPCWHADRAPYCNLARRLSSGRQSSPSCCHPCWLFALSAINCCLNSVAFGFAFRFSNLNVSFVFRISISIFQCVHAGNNCEIKMFTSLVCFICYLLSAVWLFEVISPCGKIKVQVAYPINFLRKKWLAIVMCFNFNFPSLSLSLCRCVCVWIICHDKIWECELIMARNFQVFNAALTHKNRCRLRLS